MKLEDLKTFDGLKAKKSGAGLGLFATKVIPPKTFIIEYVGPHLSEDEANEKGGKYLFEVSKKITIDGTSRENLARYINHACKPNAEIEIKKNRVLVFSTKKIAEGEEITYDYGKDYFDYYIKPYGCRCKTCVAKREKLKVRAELEK